MTHVVRSLYILALAPLLGVSLASAAPAAPSEKPNVTATLFTSVTAVGPGQPFRVGVLLMIDAGWHVYWKNPGDAGLAPSVTLSLPPGFTAAPLRWPRPATFHQPGGVVGYGYTGSVLLWADVTPPPGLKADTELALGVKVSWLACRDSCVPGQAALAMTLPTADKAAPNAEAEKLFADWAAKTDPPAPAFTLTDQDGKAVSLADFAGKVVVLEWINPDCPFVQYHHRPDVNTMAKLAAKYKARGVVWLAVNSSHTWTNEKARAYAAQARLPYPLLDDHSGTTGLAYGAKATPHMYVIDPAGLIVYRGAIDNAPMGQTPDGAPVVRYVEKALDELLASKPVATPQTNAYGCSVKYPPTK